MQPQSKSISLVPSASSNPPISPHHSNTHTQPIKHRYTGTIAQQYKRSTSVFFWQNNSSDLFSLWITSPPPIPAFQMASYFLWPLICHEMIFLFFDIPLPSGQTCQAGRQCGRHLQKADPVYQPSTKSLRKPVHLEARDCRTLFSLFSRVAASRMSTGKVCVGGFVQEFFAGENSGWGKFSPPCKSQGSNATRAPSLYNKKHRSLINLLSFQKQAKKWTSKDNTSNTSTSATIGPPAICSSTSWASLQETDGAYCTANGF